MVRNSLIDRIFGRGEAEEWSVELEADVITVIDPSLTRTKITMDDLTKIIAQKSYGGPFDNDVLLFLFGQSVDPLAFIPSRAFGFLRFVERLTRYPDFDLAGFKNVSGGPMGSRQTIFERGGCDPHEASGLTAFELSKWDHE